MDSTNVGNITGSTVGGIGSNFSVTNSFNTIAGSAAPDELKAPLTQMVEEVAKVSAAAPGETAESLERDATDLVNEAASSKPRKHILESIAGGLKATAETVGAVGVPLIALVTSIIALV